jgi:hypothetical protein
VCPPDDNLCTVDSCNPEGGCRSTPVVCQADDNLCTVEACNPSTGTCGSTPKVCDGEGGGSGVDGNACTGSPVCNPSTGNCEPGEGTVCPPDDNPCTVESCQPEGGCVSTPVVCDADDNLCTTEVCDPETGGCESGEPVACDQDKDECTTEVCDPETGECESEPANPLPGECGASICRTPGFWGTHAGVESVNKQKGTNITQAVIAAAGGSLTVCGETITSTKVADDESALEAICVSPSGAIRLQLVRQLTAAALNCVMSGGDADCSSTPLYTSIFAECNALCTQSGASTTSITSCIGRIDCLNNGGKVLANGFCQIGTCRDGSPCNKEGCDDDSTCTPDASNCHSQLLVNEDLDLDFDPPGPAGSSKSCNNANKNTCAVIGSAQANCPN